MDQVKGVHSSQPARPFAYLPIKIYNRLSDTLTGVKALLDTGNMIPQPCAMSAAFAKKIGLRYEPIQASVGTAKVGGKLIVEGLARNTKIVIAPKCIVNLQSILILRDLSGEVNLGYQFIKEIAGRLSYTPHATILKVGPDTIPLIQQIQPPPPFETDPPPPDEPEKGNSGVVEDEKGSSGEVQSWPGEDLAPEPGLKAEHGQKLESLLMAAPTTKISVFHELNNTLTTMDSNKPNLDLNKLCNNPELAKKSIFYTFPVKAPESWVQPDPGKVLFLNKNNHFHVQKKRLRLSVPSSKFVRSDSRGVVRINSFTQDGVIRTSYQAEVLESKVLAPMSVTRIHCQLNRNIINKAVKIQDWSSEDGNLRVPEGVESRLPGGRVGVWIANNSDLPQAMNSGTKLSYIPLCSSYLRLPKSQLNKDPVLGSFRETEDQVEVDPDQMDKVEDTTLGFQELWDSLKLSENKLLRQNPAVLKQTKQLIHDYQDIFSTSAPGETDLVELSLKLKEDTEPIRQKVRPLNPALEKDLEEQIDAWLQQGVIEPSESPWSSPLVPVKKKDGTVRWAVDFRRVNSCLEQDSYPLPRIQQLLEKAGGHQVYSALDATQAYFNVRIAEKSRKVTAFATPNGLYQFCRMPFGLSVSVAVYSRFIAAALNKLGTRNLNCYLDDVLVFNNSLGDHVSRLREVFQAHREAGVKLKPVKTLLFQEQIVYLGHTLSKDGIGMVDAYVERIKEWPIPKDVKELNTLLGFFSYYRNFIPDFASLTATMCKQRREKVLAWTPEMTEKLELLKAEFSKGPIRAAPRFDSEEVFQLTTDYSATAIGAVLSQVQDGEERLIGAVGRKTTEPEQRYPSWKGELSAIVYGIRKFHPILSYRQFRINTDSSALKQLKSLKQNTGMLARWQEELAGYDFTVIHRPGKENLNADALSRREGMPEPDKEEHEEHSTYIGSMNALGPATYPRELERGQILNSQAADPILRQVRLWICAGKPPEKHEVRGMSAPAQQYARNFATLDLAEDGVLIMKMDTFMGAKSRILVPDKLRDPVFRMSHEHRTAGHFGVTATIARMRKHWWYPGMATDVHTRVGVCHSCLAKIVKEKSKCGIHIPQRNGYPMQTVFIDLVGPLPESTNGNKYIMSVSDGFSRFINLYPLPSKHGIGVAKVLVDGFIKTFGCPMRIHSDNGLEFNNAMVAEISRRLDILHTRTPVYNPSSNPVERFHRTLHQLLRVVTGREDKEWEQHLPAITLAYNTKVNNATGVTPSLAFLGREAKLPVDLVLQLPDKEYETPNHGIKDMLGRYREIYNYVCTQQDGVIRRNAQQYAGVAKFKPGDRVLYFTVRGVLGKPAKHTNHWTGAWVVEEQVNEVLYRIRPWRPGSKHKSMVVNVSKLKYLHGDPDHHHLPKDLNLAIDDGDEEAEELTNSYRPPPELGVPVYAPFQAPEMSDVGQAARPPAKPDATEEPVPRNPLAPPATFELPDEMAADEEMLVPNKPGPSIESESRKREREEPPLRRETYPRRDPLKRKSEEGEWELEAPIIKQRSRLMEKVSKGMSKFATDVRDYTSAAQDPALQEEIMQDTALPSSEEEREEEDPPSLNSLCTLTERGARVPHRLDKPKGRYSLYAPSRLKLPPDKVTAVSLGMNIALPKQVAINLVACPRLSEQGVKVQGICYSKFGTLCALFHNSNKNKPIQIEHGQRYCRASLLRYEIAIPE